jgi:hypothetical protein
MNAAVLIELLLGLIDRASAISTLLNTAKSQGRDVTTAELDALFAVDATARDALEAAIAKVRAGG